MLSKTTERTGSWDQGLRFEEAEKRILEDLKQERLKRDYSKAIGKPYRKGNRVAYDCTLLIQLRNGARIGEAVQAVFQFLSTGQREQNVKAEKHRAKEVYRTIIISQEVKKADLQAIEGKDPGKVREAVKVYARRHFGFNTHSLRYAFITHLAIERKQPINVVARITEHSNLNMLAHYVEKNRANEVLKDIAK